MLPSLTKLQNVVAPIRAAVEPLYLRSTRPLFYDRVQGRIEIARGQEIDFDTYFNALFESHLVSVSTVRTVYLQLKVEGEVALAVFRSSRHAPAQLVLRQTVGAGDGRVLTHVVPIELADDEPLQGRVWFTLTGLSDGNALHEACWCVAAGEVRREVKLDAIFCTFKRERFLKRTVAAVTGVEELGERLHRVIVVDNARTLPPDAFADPRVALFQQDNVGGAGGFTRGLCESLSDERSTHFMFMDDDIELDPESVFRVVTYLSIMREEHCIAGGMFDQSRPTTLWEAGAQRDAARPFLIAPLYDGLDLADREQLLEIHRVLHPEYGAWWLFAGPKSAARTAGLPLPVFIHSDDIEYGNRLAAHGVRSVPIPGIAVWHPPFYAKTPEWMFFYDIRNHLICDSLHPKLSRWRIARTLSHWAWLDLMRYNYQHPSLMMAALRDYLAGPATAFSDPVAKHEEVTRLARENGPQSRDGAIESIRDLDELPVSQSKLRKLARVATLNGHLYARNRARPGFDAALPPWHHQWYAVEGASVAVRNPWAKGYAIWHRQPARFWSLVGEAARLLPRILLEYPRLRAKWKAEAPAHTTVAAWRKYLKLDA